MPHVRAEPHGFSSIFAVIDSEAIPADAGTGSMSEPPPGAFCLTASRPASFDLSARPEAPHSSAGLPPTALHGPAETDALFDIAALVPLPESPVPPLLALPQDLIDAIMKYLPHSAVLNLRETHRRLYDQVGPKAHLAALTEGWISQMRELQDPFDLPHFAHRTKPQLLDKWSTERAVLGSESRGLASMNLRGNREQTQGSVALCLWMQQLAHHGIDSAIGKYALIKELPQWIGKQPADQHAHLLTELIYRVMMVDHRRRLRNAWLPGEASGASQLVPLLASHPDNEAKVWLQAFNKLSSLDPNTFQGTLNEFVALAKKESPSEWRALHLLQNVAHGFIQVGLDLRVQWTLPEHFATPYLNALHEISQHADDEVVSRHVQPRSWSLLARIPTTRLHHLRNIRQTMRRVNTPDAVAVLVQLTTRLRTRDGLEIDRETEVGETIQDVRSVADDRQRHGLWTQCILGNLHKVGRGQAAAADVWVARELFEGYMSWERPADEVAEGPQPTLAQMVELVSSHPMTDLRLPALKRLFDRAPSGWLAHASEVMPLLLPGQKLTVLSWLQQSVDSGPLDEARLRMLASATSLALADQPESPHCSRLLVASLELLLRDPALTTDDLSAYLLLEAGAWCKHLTGLTQESDEVVGRASKLFNAALSRRDPDDQATPVHALTCFNVALAAPKHLRATLMGPPWLLVKAPQKRDIERLLDEFATETSHPQTVEVLQHVLLLIDSFNIQSWAARPSADPGAEWFEHFSKTLQCPGWKTAPDESARLQFLTTAIDSLSTWGEHDRDLQPQMEILQEEISRLCTSEDEAVRTEAQLLLDPGL